MKINSKQSRKEAIAEFLKSPVYSIEEIMAIKRRLAKKYKIGILDNSEIASFYREQIKKNAIKKNEILEKLLKKRSIRTMSGVAPVAVLVKPFVCPGKCAYCPNEKEIPRSYLSNEPAVMRALRCGFDPYKQVALRLKSLEDNGHEPTKIELIVIGGTWTTIPTVYKYWYIKECFRAANNYGKKNKNINYRFSNNLQVSKLKKGLLEEQKKNEKSKYKIIGITLETRPDYIDEKELIEMRELGCTRVELGVQAIDDKILKLNKRGHGIDRIISATKMLKDFGFKVTYHIMPGLPGSSAKKDLAMFKRLFNSQDYQPDQIKFYPTVVTKGSLLYRWWRAGKYKPYSDKVLEKLIIACKAVVPEYVRIIRLIRDIPGESIEAGNMITNLRQIMQQKGVKCSCIRCREAGDKKIKISDLRLKIQKYKASGGEEYFIQAVDKKDNTLFGFCRLRLFPHNAQHITHNILKNSALIRELHVYGELVSVGGDKKIQHAGLGKRLMAEAEKIAMKNGFKKIAVISGVGVRGYYKKLGYKLKDNYMIKEG